MKELYIQYGCGWSAPPGWRNFDASPTLRFERIPFIGSIYTKNANKFPDNVEYGDIVKGLPVESDSASGVYCSHILEHLALEDCRIALLNTYKILRKGGTFRLVLPDLKLLTLRYLANDSHDAAINFIECSGMGLKTRPKGIKSILFSLFGNS